MSFSPYFTACVFGHPIQKVEQSFYYFKWGNNRFGLYALQIYQKPVSNKVLGIKEKTTNQPEVAYIIWDQPDW
jgi:hypothetical protein